MPYYEIPAKEYYTTLQERLEAEARTVAEQRQHNVPAQRPIWWIASLSSEVLQALQAINDPGVQSCLYHLQPSELNHAVRWGYESAKAQQDEHMRNLRHRLNALRSEAELTLELTEIAIGSL